MSVDQTRHDDRISRDFMNRAARWHVVVSGDPGDLAILNMNRGRRFTLK
jgi:hypothetical protein